MIQIVAIVVGLAMAALASALLVMGFEGVDNAEASVQKTLRIQQLEAQKASHFGVVGVN